MSHYKDLIEFSDFAFGLRAVDKKQVIRNIAWMIGRKTNADMTWLAEQFLLSEEKESSGIGDGVAILHLKSTPLKKPFILISRLSQAVEFDAIDEQDVDIVCAVLSPQMDGNLHLQRLGRVTRLLREPDVVAHIRSALNEEEMISLFNISDTRSLAA